MLICPYAFGISSDVKSLKILNAMLEEKFGISCCAKEPTRKYLQWDYPIMWAPIVYFFCQVLKYLDEKKFKEVSNKYLNTVETVFKKTGKLWEKYNAINGITGNSDEYKTPSMLGWTAGLYLWLKKQLN